MKHIQKHWKEITSLTILAVSVWLSFLYIPAQYATAITTYPPGSLLQPSDVTSSHIRNGTIINEDVSSTAAIAYSKLNLVGSIANADVSSTAAIAYSKLNLVGLIANADVSSTAAIADTKLAQISTAGKVSGTALTSLSSIPSGAGVIPSANLPDLTPTTTSTAGEALSANDAVFIANTSNTNIKLENYPVSLTYGFGRNSGTDIQRAQSIQATSSILISSIEVMLKKEGSPTDNAIIQIQSDNSNAPSGTILSSSTIAGTSLTTATSTYAMTMIPEIIIEPNTKYWIVFTRSGALSATDLYILTYSSTNTYANGARAGYNGSSWTVDTNEDHYFKIVSGMQANKAYKTSAALANESNAFVGFTQSAYAKNDIVTIVTGGAKSGFTLTPGNQYFLSSTRGAIAVTTSTVTRKVGISVSSSTLLITNIW